MNSKIFLVLISLVCLFSIANAISVSVTNPIVQGTNWTIEASFSNLSNTESSRLFIDNEEIFVITKVSNLVLAESSSSKVIDFSRKELNVSFIMVGLNNGFHTITIKRYDSSNNLIEENSYDVEFIIPVSSYEKDQLTNELSKLKKDYESEISSLNEQLIEKNNEIDSLDNSITILQSTISNLEEKESTNSQNLEKINLDVNELMTSKNTQPLAFSSLNGLFLMGVENSGIILAVCLLLLLIGIVLYLKSKDFSVYSFSLPKFNFSKNNSGDSSSQNHFSDHKDMDSQVKDISKSLSTETKTDSGFSLNNIFSVLKKDGVELGTNHESNKLKPLKIGKWATESYYPENASVDNKTNSRFNAGDLIKKNF
ncbi:MAG: hypothetical protein PHQ98_01010 [Candidatus ainarchaeum sp.]|nr:hypothetical protein [Candidatus ainarchaeum sp.]